MKHTIRILSVFLILALCIPFTVSADEIVFTAQKTAVKVSAPGEIVECIVTAEDRDLFSYRAQLVYDPEILEFVSAVPSYIRGVGKPILYDSDGAEMLPQEYYDREPAPVAYNVPGALTYWDNNERCGYYGENNFPGIYRTISTIMGYDGRTEGNEVLKITLRAKKAGTSFLYLMDEQTAVLTEEHTVLNDTVTTNLTVRYNGTEKGSVIIHDMSDIAYPWRTTQAVFQEGKAESASGIDLTQGTLYDVSYPSETLNIRVKDADTIICTIPYAKEGGVFPGVVRKSPFGDITQITRVRYDKEAGTVSFVVGEFGDYIISDLYYSVSDCSEGSDVYNAVCYLKSIGVLDANSDSFAPDRAITKAEFLKMLVCAMGPADPTSVVWFSDVAMNDWCYKYIATAVKLGLVSETEGAFGPNDVMDASQAAVMLQKASNLINQSSEVNFSNEEVFTRGEAAVAIRNMLCLKLN